MPPLQVPKQTTAEKQKHVLELQRKANERRLREKRMMSNERRSTGDAGGESGRRRGKEEDYERSLRIADRDRD